MFYDMVQITSHFLWGIHVWRREAHMEAWADGVPPSSATLTSFCCCHWRTLCVRACVRNRPVFVWRAPKARFHGNICRGGGGWLIPNKESIYLVWSLLVQMMLLYSDRQAGGRVVSWATFGLRRGSFSRITHHLINIHPITPKWQRPIMNLSLDYSESTVNVTSWHLEMFVGN